jgi:hypothetical protein
MVKIKVQVSIAFIRSLASDAYVTVTTCFSNGTSSKNKEELRAYDNLKLWFLHHVTPCILKLKLIVLNLRNRSHLNTHFFFQTFFIKSRLLIARHHRN